MRLADSFAAFSIDEIEHAESVGFAVGSFFEPDFGHFMEPVFEFPLALDKRGPQTLARRLHQQLRAAIVEQRLAACGIRSRLPPWPARSSLVCHGRLAPLVAALEQLRAARRVRLPAR
ncbi:MAG: hypothetical protein KGQ57_01810 [Burkholderiales bacterium]|nr:hypothetical protein [Burkholderiales bacterium]